MRMVRVAPKPSLREASCCRVEVVKGDHGLRLTCLCSTEATEKASGVSRLTTASAAPLSPRANLSSFLPSSWIRWAVKVEPSAVRKVISMVQNSWGRKASISPSRWQISLSATDCTRPADFEPGSLRHRTGERVKPTR